VDSENLKEEPDTRPINNEVNQLGLRKRSGMCRQGHGKECLEKRGREKKKISLARSEEQGEAREQREGVATLKRNELN
jgi:hypothetical protein